MSARRLTIAVAIGLATLASQVVVASAACASSCGMMEAPETCCPLAPKRPPAHNVEDASSTCCDSGIWYAFDDARMPETVRDTDNRRLIAVAPILPMRSIATAIDVPASAYPRPPPPPGTRPNATIVLLL